MNLELEDWEIGRLTDWVSQKVDLNLPISQSPNGASDPMPVVAKPTARVLIARTRVRDKPPEVARVIELAQMHQLVNQDVLAHTLGHHDETPIQTDVAGTRARSPARPLIPYADTRHLKAVMLGQAQQLRGQLQGGLPSQLPHNLWCVRRCARRVFLDPRLLALNPRPLLLDK